MSYRKKTKSRLPEQVEKHLARIRAQGSLSLPELDALLAALEPERFQDQNLSVIAALATIPLNHKAAEPAPGEAAESDRDDSPYLPFGGRVSRRYLKDILRFPTMTREDEVRHARRMEFVTARLMAAEFETRSERLHRRREFEAVRSEFVQRNLHLVVSHAYAYRTYGVPLDDLVQEGNTALIRACEKFDWRHEVRFKTYVAYWIRQAIERYLASQKGAVRVPHHLQQRFRRLKREGRLPRHRDQDMTVNQVAEAFEISRETASHLLESSRTAFSLEQEMTPEGDTYRDFLLEDWQPEDGEARNRLRERLGNLMHDLDDRERTVLSMRFGLSGKESVTLEEVGKTLHLSRERSRQIQQRALSKLRRAAEEQHLSDYL